MKRLLVLFAAVGLAALALPSAPSTVPVRGQSGINPSQWYSIISRHSGKCLDIIGGSLSAGTRLVQSTCHFGDNQAFRFNPVGGGIYTITAGHSALCIDQANATFANGGQFMQYFCHGGTNQRFQVINGLVGVGVYNQIRVQHSLKNMDVANGSFANGAFIIQFDPHGGVNQQFELRPVATPCAGRDNDNDGTLACFDCDDNNPAIQECPEEPPCCGCEFCD